MKKIILILLLPMLLGLSAPALADTTSDAHKDIQALKELEFQVDKILTLDEKEQGTSYFYDTRDNPIVSFIIKVINFALTIIGSIAIIILILAGFMMMVSQGNQQKLDEAKDMFKYAIIGLLVTFLAYIIVIFVQSIFIT